MHEQQVADPRLVEASAPGIGVADAIFVFGTLHPTPAEVAATHYQRGHASLVVVTGGVSRARPGHHEALRHRDLLVSHGVPASAIVVEDRSRTTDENVTMAVPQLADLVEELRTVIAVVKWFHRRALVTLAHHVTSIERIYAAAYEPYDPVTGKLLLRSTWQTTSPRSVTRETRYMRSVIAAGADPLRRDGNGWVRGLAVSDSAT